MNGTETFSDGDLVAYLDGELGVAERRAVDARLASDGALKERLDRLAAGARPFRELFDLLLASAPIDRLRAGLDQALAANRPATRKPQYRSLLAIAAAVILFVLGGVAGHIATRNVPALSGGSEQAAETWRAVVAEYLTLYTSETLADIPDDPALKADELRRVGTRLGVDLGGDKVQLAGLDLKRAQIFDLDGAPLAQITYLSERDGPVAFCIIRDGEADAAPDFEVRDGKNIVYWVKGGRAYMLIGKTARPALEALASELAARIT